MILMFSVCMQQILSKFLLIFCSIFPMLSLFELISYVRFTARAEIVGKKINIDDGRLSKHEFRILVTAVANAASPPVSVEELADFMQSTVIVSCCLFTGCKVVLRVGQKGSFTYCNCCMWNPDVHSSKSWNPNPNLYLGLLRVLQSTYNTYPLIQWVTDPKGLLFRTISWSPEILHQIVALSHFHPPATHGL